MLLLAVQSDKAISASSNSVEQAFTKSSLVSCINSNIYKLQRTKSTGSVQCELLRIDLLPNSSEKPKRRQMHQQADKSIAQHEYNEESCATDFLESDYSEDDMLRNICSHHCHMKVNPRQILAPNVLSKMFGASISPRERCHVVRLTVIYDLIQSGFVNATTTLAIFSPIREEYPG